MKKGKKALIHLCAKQGRSLSDVIFIFENHESYKPLTKKQQHYYVEMKNILFQEIKNFLFNETKH